MHCQMCSVQFALCIKIKTYECKLNIENNAYEVISYGFSVDLVPQPIMTISLSFVAILHCETNISYS